MGRTVPAMPAPRFVTWAFAFLVVASLATLHPASAAALGRIQGKVVATDSGEPIGYADVLLVPADTTMKKVGGLTNADGTFLLAAPAGRYAMQVRALSYARKRIEGVVIQEGQLLPLDAALSPEAIQQEEIVVEATAKQNTEASMLAQRKKASSLGDAISAEQMRRAPDKDAGEVLRRVTGLSVSEGKYVYVRGLGERYSSTEVDGVRIASPEQNKRVVPMDLFPAALLDNIVVQKTYTADRAGEFSGGDVQVRTKDFPGKRMWALSVAQSAEQGVTGADRLTYASTAADVFGFGASSRSIPGIVDEISGGKPLTQGAPPNGFPVSTLQTVEKDFANVWSATGGRTSPNGSYTLTYGDQYSVAGRPLGLVSAWSMSHGFDRTADEIQRTLKSNDGALGNDYVMQSYTEKAELGGNAAVSYRVTPGFHAHVRGFFTNSAEDEVRTYEGLDNYSDPLYRRATRLQYVQRDIGSVSAEGQHDFARLAHLGLDWRFTRSTARRQQPDRRESMYIRVPTDPADPNSGYWGLATGRREYGDLKDNGWGTHVQTNMPYRLAGLGNGKLSAGYDRDSKSRDNFYRRFDFIPGQYGSDAAPESVYDQVNEATLPEDNYGATQLVEAVFVSTDIPLGNRLRGNLGIRRERGRQDVVSYDLFNPSVVTSQGEVKNTDWLGGANLVWSVTGPVNVRAAASRTLNRPDLDELSPRPTLDYVGDYLRLGNPNLKRSTLENYDLRVEAFPGGGELLAAGVFVKRMHDPIEYTVRGGSSVNTLVPDNSDKGQNVGLELELRSSLGRVSKSLQRFSINSNISFIKSQITLKDGPTRKGSVEHPLQGQADRLLNASLNYQSPGGGMESSVLVSYVGRRLVYLSNPGEGGPEDHYDPGTTSLDVSFGFMPFKGGRIKLAAGNLLGSEIREYSSGFLLNSHKTGRRFSVGFSYGS